MSSDPYPPKAQELLRRIDESLAGLTGRDFFLALVSSLTDTLAANCAFVCEFIDGNSRASPIAFWLRGAPVDVAAYDLAGTPCECVLAGEVVAFEQDVAKLFPEDREGLEAIGAESYVAIPMKSRRGGIIGHIAVIDTCRRDWVEADTDVLRLCASRASAELEHDHTERDLSAENLALERRVSERTRELERAYEEMEQRVAERTASLAAVNARLRHEVAARAGAERALLRQEKAYRDLYENAPNVYWSTGADGHVKRVNRRAEELFGYAREELIGKAYSELIATRPEAREKARKVFARFLEGEPTFDEELEFRAADGHAIWAKVSVVPILDDAGKPIATRSVLDDITERKRAEEALKRRLDLERLLVEVATGFVGVRPEVIDSGFERAVAKIGAWGSWDRVRVFLGAARKQAPRLAYGWSREERGDASPAPLIPGRFRRDDESVVDIPDVTKLGDCALAPLLADAGVGALIVVSIANETAVLGFVELACFGRAHGWLPEDVQLLRLLGEIMASTLQRCDAERELERARLGAVAASQAKSEFLARMSHELRTPLNAILGYAQLMQRDPTFEDVRRRSQIEIIRRSGEHLLTLINEVLDLARIEAGKLDIRGIEVDVRALARDIEAMFASRAEEAGLTFHAEWVEPLPTCVIADDRRLRQILINLLGNAVKFTPADGSVMLKISASDVEGSECNVVFEIEDTGVGIPDSQLTKIFEPFHQVDGGSGEGMGLGLAITQRLVAAMQGRLEVASQAGVGTKFKVTVPLTAVPTVPADVSPSAKIIGFAGKPRKILVVDDYGENRAVLCNLLRPLGFTVEEVADGEAAVAAVAAFAPDLLFIDLVMPKLGGLAAVRRIRTLPGTSNLKIVAVSASAFEQTRRESLEAGCDGFIAKPIQLDDALELVGRLLQLGWLRESPQRSARQAGPGQAPAIRLPHEHASELYELARAGDIVAIDAYLKRLEVEQCHIEFVARVRALTGRFDLRGVQALLAPLVNADAGATEEKR